MPFAPSELTASRSDTGRGTILQGFLLTKQIFKLLNYYIMNTYFIETTHDVYIDNYKNGEEQNVNFYTIEKHIEAENPRAAIEKYFEKVLCCKFSFEGAYITHEEEGEEEPQNKLNYSVLVDEDNSEASENQIEAWREGKKKLYSNNITLFIYEVQPIKI